MRMRPLPLLLVLALLPAEARADRHTVECFGSGSATDGESDEASTDDDSTFLLAINCVGFLEAIFTGGELGSAEEYEGSGPFYPTVDVRLDTAGTLEAMLGLAFVDGHERAQPFVKIAVGGISRSSNGDRSTDPAALVGGGIDFELNRCPAPPSPCQNRFVGTLRGQVDVLTVLSSPRRAFPRVSVGVGFRFE